MRNKEKLNPCRYCNGKAVVCRKKTVSGDTGYYVKCPTCGHHTNITVYLDGTTDSKAIENAITIWNYS